MATSPTPIILGSVPERLLALPKGTDFNKLTDKQVLEIMDK